MRSTGTETGGYTFSIDSDVGDDDHGNTIAEATTVTLNTTVSGTITPGNDIDYFRLDINTTTFVTIYTTGGLDTAGSLQDKNGVELTSNDDVVANSNFRISALLNPETYYIGVEESNSLSTGDYVLHVDVVTVTEIGLNTSVSETIDPAGDVDYFSIEISTPTFVSIFTTGRLDTLGSLQGNIDNITSDDNSGKDDNFRINIFLDPGTYYIGVEKSDSPSTGNYTIHVDVITLTEIELDTSASGTIDLAGDVDYFSLEISTTILVSIFTTNDRDTIGAPYDIANILLLTPGTYSIRVGEFNTRSTGSYTLHVRAVTVTPLPLNTPVSGTIDPAGDVDYFSIEIDTQTNVNIFTTGNLNTRGALYDDDEMNTLLRFDDNSGEGDNFLISTNLEMGTYFIRVESPASLSTGKYVFRVAVDNHGNTTETATTLPLNIFLPGRIDPADDVDYFRIRITFQTFVTISTTGDLDTVGRLINSVGDVLQSDDNSGDRDNFRIQDDNFKPGTYYIEVSSTGTETGDYRIHVDAEGEGDHGDTIETTTDLLLDTIVSGKIDSVSDVDHFSIEISAPTRVAIFTIGNLDTIGTLYDGTNTLLASDDDSGKNTNFLILSPLNRGTYYIEVRSTGTETGDYTLRIDSDVGEDDHGNTIAEATTVTLNTTVSGTIDPAIDIDYFRLDISTQTVVAIYTTGGLDTSGSLQDNNGVELASNDGVLLDRNFRITGIFNRGTYYIGVEESNSLSTGDYVLHVAAVTVTEIALDSSVSGTTDPLDPVNDIDYFRIDIRTTVLVSIFTTNDRDTIGAPYDETNIRLFDPGTHYIYVSSGVFPGIGSYTLHLNVVTVTPLPLNTSVSETIDPAGDVDYFSLEIDTQTNVNIFTTDNLDTMGTLYDGTYTRLQFDNNSGRGDNFLISDRLDSGTYYIRVESPASRSTGNYVLYVDEVVPRISFQQDRYVIFEGTTGTVTLVADQSPVVEARISLTTDSVTILNSEYRLSTTIIVFKPDQSTASFEVSIFDDNVRRVTRELSLSINPLKNSTRGAVFETVISVKDNDVPIASLEVVGVVGVVGDDIRLKEGANVTLRVTLDRSFEQATTIQIVTAGTADLGEDEDYTITDNPVELSTGNTSVETQLTILVDLDDQELDETIILTLKASNNLIIVDGSGAQLTLTIGRADLLFRIKVFLEGAQ